MSATPDAPWASVSMVWALPLPRGALAGGIDPTRWQVAAEDPRKGWSLDSIDTSWWPGRSTSGVRSRTGWFNRSRLATATLSEDSQVHLAADPGVLECLREIGVSLQAMELRQHAGADELDVLCLHLRLSGTALTRPAEVAQLLRRPGRLPQLLQAGCRWQDFMDEINTLLQSHGLDAELQGGGYLWGASRNSREVRPLVLSHLVPARPDPAPPSVLAGYRHWDANQAWAWAMASGANADLYFRLPPDTAAAATSSTAWIGHTLARAEGDGLSLLATRPATDPSVENVDTQLLLHGRFLDLALLSLRQQSFLQRHANRLATTASTWGGDDAHDDLGEVIGHEERLLRFRNRVWFSSVPARPEGTTVLQLIQAQYDSPTLLTEIAAEQADMARILDLRDSSRRRQAAERAEAERSAQTELNERQQAEQERTRRTVETGVAILTPPAVICGLAALLLDPSVGLFLISLGVSLAVVLLFRAYFRTRRAKP